MDTIAQKMPATLPWTAWSALAPAAAARAIQTRVAALAPALRSAALTWLRPERELALDLAARRATDPLCGIPYFLKDLFDLGGIPTRAGSTFLDQARGTPTADSAIVTRLRALGASCAGKTQLVEFASGLTGENPHFGDCPHPLFSDRLSGGSSSGSAALVAAGVVPLALGTDTGGSIRVPAAWCGLYGFRLTPAQEWISDAFPLAPTMDTAGWFTGTAEGMLATWQALVGPASQLANFRGCYLPLSALLPTADLVTDQACTAAAEKICPLADAATQAELLAAWRDAVDAYITIGMSEAYHVHRDWLAPYREHYDPLIWQRFSAAANYPAAQIQAAHATLARMRQAFAKYFLNHDFLILPAVPCAAPHKADCTPELRRNILTLTAPASLGGLPVLSLPVPLPFGLTAGLQIILPHAKSPVVPWLLKPE